MGNRAILARPYLPIVECAYITAGSRAQLLSQASLDAELAVETDRLAAMNSGDLARYQYALENQIMRNWIEPPSALPGIECVVRVRQLPNGEVVEVSIAECNGDDAVRRSIEAAVHKASPLPLPSNRSLFDRNLTIRFRPEQ